MGETGPHFDVASSERLFFFSPTVRNKVPLFCSSNFVFLNLKWNNRKVMKSKHCCGDLLGLLYWALIEVAGLMRQKVAAIQFWAVGGSEKGRRVFDKHERSQSCSIQHSCGQVCAILHNCARLCALCVHGCMPIVHSCAQVYRIVHICPRMERRKQNKWPVRQEQSAEK